MTPREFVEGFAREKASLLHLYLNETTTPVGAKIAKLHLEHEGRELLAQILDGALTDALYTILLGLDGEASIGGRQETYKLLDEDGNVLTGGEIEGEAWKVFHGHDEEREDDDAG